MQKLLPLLSLILLLGIKNNVSGQNIAPVAQPVAIDSAERVKKIMNTIDICTKAIDSKSQDNAMLSSTYAIRGTGYLSLKEYNKAISDYTTAMALNPMLLEGYYRKAIAYEGLKDYQSAIKQYEMLLSYNKDNQRATASIYNSIAWLQLQLKQYDKAIKSDSIALSLQPSMNEAYVTRGRVYLAKGKNELAILDFTTAMGGYENKKKPLSMLYAGRADAEVKLKKYKEALNDYSAALKLEPDYKYAIWNRAGCYNMNGDYQLAADDYNTAIKFYNGDNKNLSKLYDDRARMEIGMQQYQKAISDDSVAISLNNKYAPAYWDQAGAYAQNADFQLSINGYEACMDFYKSDKTITALIYSNIANEEYFLKEYPKVIHASNAAIAFDSKSWEAYFNRGRAYLKTQDKDDAMADFDKVLKLDTTKKSSEYAFVLFYMGKPDAAIDIMQKNVIATTDSYLLLNHYYNLACLYSLMNKPDEANSYLKKCVDGGYSKKYAIADSDLDNIRNTDEFKAMINK